MNRRAAAGLKINFLRWHLGLDTYHADVCVSGCYGFRLDLGPLAIWAEWR